MTNLAEDHRDSVDILGYCWDREKREFVVQVPKQGNTFYGSLSFPFFQPSQVKFGEIIIRGWSSKVCLKIQGMGERDTLLCLVQVEVLWDMMKFITS